MPSGVLHKIILLDAEKVVRSRDGLEVVKWHGDDEMMTTDPDNLYDDNFIRPKYSRI